MPTTIFARPDNGPIPTSTPVPATGDGPLQAAWDQTAEPGAVAASGPESLAQRVTNSLAELRKETVEHSEAMYELGRQREIELAQLRAEFEAELVKIRASRRMAVDYIRGPVGEGYIYVIAFTTGVVKVGQTEDPKRRLGEHQSEAMAYGVGATNYWISPPHRNFKNNETHLIKLCAKVSKRSRREYYHEVGYERAVDFAWTLTFDSEGPDQPAVECGWS